MESLAALGKVAGIAGVAVGAATVVFRDVIRMKVFPKLPASTAYRLLRLIVVASWSIAVLGILLWSQPTLLVGDGNTVIRDSTLTSEKATGKGVSKEEP